jgi:hypothetical protein
MGLLDVFKKKEEKELPKEVTPEMTEEERQKVYAERDVPKGKYAEACAGCGGSGTDKKWMGQYWHKKCCRNAKKQAKKML